MPKSIDITLAGKKYTVYECKIKTLEAFAGDVARLVDALFTADKVSEAKEAVTQLLYEKLPKLFPGITKEMIEESYPSELQELGKAFIDLHFFALKSLVSPLMAAIQAGLQGRFSPSWGGNAAGPGTTSQN